MHIVHVVRQFQPAVGGMETVVLELASAQAAKGHAVRVVTLNRLFEAPSERLPTRENIDGIEVIRVSFRGSNRYPLAVGVLRHIADADVVHVHGLDFFFDFLAWTQPLHRRRLVVSTHGGYFHTPFAAILKRMIFPTVTRFSLSRYGGVVTVSASDQQLFQSIRSRGSSLIENGVNTDKFHDAGARSASKVMLALGRFSTNKRLEGLIAFLAAIRRIDPQWSLKIVGRPADLTPSDLKTIAAELGMSNAVDIVTLPSDAELREVMRQCSVIVSASSYEGFGVAVIEGMSAGLFPVLNDIPPFRDLVNRHGFGLILDFEQSDAAASRFIDEWQRIAADFPGHRARAIAATKEYGWARVSEQYEAVYDSVLGQKARSILDIAVGVHTFNGALRLLDQRFQKSERAMVVFANAHTLNNTFKDDGAKAALRDSIVFNDGIGVNLASRLLFGKWFPENLNGTDFIPDYLRHTRHRFRIFFLGAKPGIAERAAAYLMAINPVHELAGTSHGYLGTSDTDATVETIRKSRADVLLVAMGDPMQELWLKDHLAETGCRFGFAVGGLFDFMAQAVPRAPRWVQRLHMEWLFRLAQEPTRLWQRYLVGMPIFLARVAHQWFSGPRITGSER
jgi:alpha-1,3-mannosyltransferase